MSIGTGQVLLQVLQVSLGGSVEQVEVVRQAADPQPDPPDPPQDQVRVTDYPLGVADVEREREWWQQLPAPVEVGRGGTSIDCGRGTLVRPRGKPVSRGQLASTRLTRYCEEWSYLPAVVPVIPATVASSGHSSGSNSNYFGRPYFDKSS